MWNSYTLFYSIFFLIKRIILNKHNEIGIGTRSPSSSSQFLSIIHVTYVQIKRPKNMIGFGTRSLSIVISISIGHSCHIHSN